MRRYSPHRVTVIVVGVVTVAVVGTFGRARTVVADNESRLLTVWVVLLSR